MPCEAGWIGMASNVSAYLGHAFEVSAGNAQLYQYADGSGWCPISLPLDQASAMCLNCDRASIMMPGWILRVAYLVWALLMLLYFWEGGCWHKSQSGEQAYLCTLYVSLFLVTAVWFYGIETTIPFDFVSTLSVFLLLFFVVIQHLVDSYKSPFLPDFYSKPGARRKVQNPPPPATHVGVYAVHVINEGIPEWCAQEKDASVLFPIKVLLLSMLGFLTLSIQDNFVVLLLIEGVFLVWVFELVVMGPYTIYKYCKARRVVHDMEDAVEKVSHEHGCKESLVYMLTKVNVASVLMASSKISRMLCEEALENGLLDVTSKAILLDALQSKQMGWYQEQKYAKNLITSCDGGDLTFLKTLIDGSGGFQNFYKLVYTDIYHASLRDEIMAHVREQSDAYRQKRGGEPVATKVLSDIDDTLNCSGGAPAGADKQYPKKAVYPGCTPFYEAILGLNQELPEVNLVFLSARPHVYKNYAEAGSYALFRALNDSDELHTYPTLLPGQIASSTFGGLCLLCMKNRSWAWVGKDKYKTFVKYRRLYREYDFIFCGDDGQGDLLAGEMMIDETEEDAEELGPHVTAVVIHCGPTGEARLAVTPPEDRGEEWVEDMAQRGLYFHKTYVGAAVDVHNRAPELMTAEEVAEISNKAVSDFDDLRYIYPEWDEDKRMEAEEELQHDIGRAAPIAKKAGIALKNIPMYETESESCCDSALE